MTVPRKLRRDSLHAATVQVEQSARLVAKELLRRRGRRGGGGGVGVVVERLRSQTA